MRRQGFYEDQPAEVMPGGPAIGKVGKSLSQFRAAPNCVVYAKGSGVVTVDPNDFTYDDRWGALVVRARDLSKYKAIVATENTDATASSYSSMTAERVSSGVVVAGFGVGYGAVVGQKGGTDKIQVGAITWEYDGSFQRWGFLLRTAWDGDNNPVLYILSRGDMRWQVKAGSGGWGLSAAVVTRASVTSPLEGAIIYDPATDKFYGYESATPSWVEFGSSGVAVKDEGAALGTATTLDFVGAGVTATYAAGVATVTVPGTTVPYWRLKMMLKSVAAGTVTDSPYFDDPNLYVSPVATGPVYLWGPYGGFSMNGYDPLYCVWAKMGVTTASGVTMNVTLICGDNQAGMWVQEPDARTGTIFSVDTATGAVVGTGTSFTTQYAVGDCIKFADGQICYITVITDNTHLTIQTVGQDAVYTSGQAHYRCRKVIDRKSGTPSTTDTGTYTFTAGKSYIIHIFAHNEGTQFSWNFFCDVLSLTGATWFDSGV